MGVSLAVIGAALLSLPLTMRRWGRRIPPARWARLVAVCTTCGALLWVASLVLMGLPTVVSATHSGGLAGACARVLSHFQPPGSPFVGWMAAGLATWTIAAMWRAARRSRRGQRVAHVEPWLGVHSRRDGFDLVVLPCGGTVAMSVPGSPDQVVVSDELVESLSDEHLDVVLRHEAAHLRYRHHRYLALSAVVLDGLRYLPVARRAPQVLATALERWADEDAGTGPAGRGAVRDALLAVTATVVADGVAAFAGVGTVLERVAALEGPPPDSGIRPSLVVAVPVAVLFGLAAAALAAGRDEFRVLLSLIGLCSS